MTAKHGQKTKIKLRHRVVKLCDTYPVLLETFIIIDN